VRRRARALQRAGRTADPAATSTCPIGPGALSGIRTPLSGYRIAARTAHSLPHAAPAFVAGRALRVYPMPVRGSRVPRGVRPRLSLAASLALHVVLGGLLLAAPALRSPAPLIPIEVRPLRRVAPRPAAPPTPTPPTPAPHVPRARPRPGPARTPPPPPPAPEPAPAPPRTAELRSFAPGDARLLLLLRTDRLRRSPHRAAVELLLSALPDHRTLIAGSGLSAIDDLDALLLATANPFDVTATFLAARHPEGSPVRAALGARPLPAGDPRTYRFPEPTLTVLGRPTLAPPRGGDHHPTPAPDGGEDDDPAALEARWLRNLALFERAAGERSGPALLVEAQQLEALGLYFRDGLAVPLSVSLAATADEAPLVRARLQFAGEPEAGAFEQALPSVWRRILAARLVDLPGFPTLGQMLPLSPLLSALTARRDGAVVELVGQLPAEPLARLLALAPMLVPRPPEEAPLARPPAAATSAPPAPGPGPAGDGGASAGGVGSTAP
jgi:hypothetical protein